MQTDLIKVTGMTCGGCTSKVTQALEKLPGVHDVRVSQAAGEAAVEYDETRISPDQLALAVSSAGFGIGPKRASAAPAKRGCCS